MARMAILVSPEVCIGCRACQVACKSWNQLPAEKSVNRGSFENPAELTPKLYNRIHYVEVPSNKDPFRWLFVNQRCMHCDDAGCKKVCPAPGALYKTKEGAVAYNKDKCISCKLCVVACPFNVPRYDEKEKVSKCNLCADRIANGLHPACTKTCPTGALRYSERDAGDGAFKPSVSAAITHSIILPPQGHRDFGSIRVWADTFAELGDRLTAFGHVFVGPKNQGDAGKWYSVRDNVVGVATAGPITMTGQLAFVAGGVPLLEGTYKADRSSGVVTLLTSSIVYTRLGTSVIRIRRLSRSTCCNAKSMRRPWCS